jgi:hypothetical protein
VAVTLVVAASQRSSPSIPSPPGVHQALVLPGTWRSGNSSTLLDPALHRHSRRQRRSVQHPHDLKRRGGRRAYLSDPGVLPGSVRVNTSLVLPDVLLNITTSGLQHVCPIVNCSLASTCTSRNATCCMHFMRKMWDFLVRFAAAHGMEDEYFAVYGSVLGALREKEGMVPWSEDMDIGASSRLVRLLESTVVRQKLWQYGYYFFWYGIWRLCAHGDHPDPLFQAAMTTPRMCPTRAPCQPGAGAASPAGSPQRVLSSKQRSLQHAWHDTHLPAVYVDVYSAAPAAMGTEGWLVCGDACQKAPANPSLPMARHLWRVCSGPGWAVVSFSRTASIAGVQVVIPDNAEEHLAVTYGDGWRVPEHGNNGRALNESAGCPRRGLFAGAPDVGKRSWW